MKTLVVNFIDFDCMVWYDSRSGVILPVEIDWVKKSSSSLLLNDEKIRCIPKKDYYNL
jgi:hypothetical protein